MLFIGCDPAACEGVRTAFEKRDENVRLEFISSPGAAFEALQREAADAIFVNAPQSGTDAPEFLRRLASINRQAPLIMIFPHSNDELVVRALREGAADCVAADRKAWDEYPAVALRAIARTEAARQNSEQAREIIQNQKQWMSIIDAITDFIFVIDGEQRIVKVNNAFATAIGSHPRIIVGNHIRDVFSLDIPDEAFLRQLHQDGMPRTYEKKIGEEIYQISIFPLQENSHPLTVHVLKNVTDVRRLKDQLYHSDKLASIGLLVSGVAHEINNPLTGTIAYTELLAMRVTDESIKTELKKILDSAERCKKIVDNLMSFSRQRTPSRSIESINDIIDRAIDLQSYWLKSNNIEIAREYDPLSTVFVDAQQIQEVVLNLVMNAEQAIADAGKTRGRIRFATKFDKKTQRVTITITDNGPGIPAKVASKIFDPFFTTKPVGVGSGLGLSISHGIISEHGGTIRFENAPDGGAAFTIELPTGTAMLTASPENRTNKSAQRG